MKDYICHQVFEFENKESMKGKGMYQKKPLFLRFRAILLFPFGIGEKNLPGENTI